MRKMFLVVLIGIIFHPAILQASGFFDAITSSKDTVSTPGSGGNNPSSAGTTSSSADWTARATAQSSSSILVTWDAVPGADSYEVVYMSSNIATFTSYPIETVGNIRSTSYTHTGLDANLTYFYKVWAKNRAGAVIKTSTTVETRPLSSGGGGNSFGNIGTLNIIGLRSANVLSVRAFYTNIIDRSQLVSLLSSNAGFGMMLDDGIVTWGRGGDDAPPSGRSYTIVVEINSNRDITYWKATNVYINNGSGSVAWGNFRQLN